MWFFGQMASLFGTWMQSTAQGYLVYELTHSAVYLGIVGFAAGIPSWIFMLYGGVVSDRMSRRKLLVITQTTMMVLAAILAVLSFLGWVQPWHIIVLAFLLGVANAFDMPARQSFTLEMVEREDLGNAIALNSAMFNTGTAIGPAMAGLAYASLGAAWCFTINAISFLAVIAALLRMQLKPTVNQPLRGSHFENLKEGLKYVKGHSVIRSLITILGVTTLLGASFATLIPEWAVNILGGDATTNGLLQSARGVGSLIGALTIATLGRFHFHGKLLSLGMFMMPFFLILFGFTRWLPFSLILLVGVGMGMMFQFNMCNTLVQSLSPDNLRGRVMGIYSLMFMGLMPVGSLMFGFLADTIGSPDTIITCSALLLVFATLIWFFNPQVKRQK